MPPAARVRPIGVVLAGGRSSRMGTDKAVVRIGGVAMARRVADALAAGGCDPVWCQGGDAARLRAIGLEVRPDPVPHGGLLAAIAAALRSAEPADAVLAACALPDLDAGTVAALIAAGERDRPLVAAASDASGTHLAAWWSAEALAPLESLRTAGLASYRAAVEQLGGLLVPVAARVVRNVNQPDDL